MVTASSSCSSMVDPVLSIYLVRPLSQKRSFTRNDIYLYELSNLDLGCNLLIQCNILITTSFISCAKDESYGDEYGALDVWPCHE